MISAQSGVLNLTSPVDNTAGTVTVTASGTLQASSLQGGTLNIIAGGKLGGGTTLQNIANPGTMTVGSGIIYLSGTLNNTGEVTFAGDVASADSIYLNNSLTLTGGGQVLLVNANSQIVQATGTASLINQNNTIHGQGSLNTPVTNQSVISAEGGVLNLTSPVNNTTGTVTVAANGTLQASSLQGGTLNITAGGKLGSGTTLQNIANPGTMTVGSGIIYLSGTLNNTGEVTFAGDVASTDSIYLTSPLTLTGSGQVLLVNANSQIVQSTGTASLINQGNNIHGQGYLYTPITNQGLIGAEGGTLTATGQIDGSGKIQIAQKATLQVNASIVGTQTITLSSKGIFNSQGATLQFKQFSGNLVQNYGALTPSASTISGNYTGGNPPVSRSL